MLAAVGGRRFKMTRYGMKDELRLSKDESLLIAERFQLTFDVKLMTRVTLVQQLARLRRHFFLDFIFQ